MNFMEKLHTVLNDRKKLTENGAIGYETSGNALMDLNFSVASLRNKSEAEIIPRFLAAFYEDRMLALKWLFFLRDVRGGLGERRTFRILIRYLAESFPEITEHMIEIIAEYGRFDDLLCLFDTPVEEKVLTTLKEQLRADLEHMKHNESISLCAKWMPGNNASSGESIRKAKKLQRFLGLTSKEYRKMLASFRAYLSVTEVYMSGNRWQEIDYTKVASGANLLYRRAFLLHDETRRKNYLEKVKEAGAIMHAGVLMPHEIAARYTSRFGWSLRAEKEDDALEALWKNLPDTVAEAKNVMCVVDGSGSMCCPVGQGNTLALHVSNALGIYFAERMSGVYRNKFITFSSRPSFVDLSSCKTLKEKLELSLSHSDCSNTNIEATFSLILQTAVQNHLLQKDLPRTILIISDMEFDNAVCGCNTDTLFYTIREKFAKHGYRMPKLVFWNVNSRTNVIPVRENELGVGLVSGFSVNICNMVLSNELDPYVCLKKMLNSEQYQKVEDVIPRELYM